jgi:hypothetical protein
MKYRYLKPACAMVLCLAWVATCSAAEPLAGLMACRGLADAVSRLACFDREAAALALVSPVAPAAQAAPVPMLDPQQKFGLSQSAIAAREAKAGSPSTEPSTIRAKLVQVAAGADGRLVFTLDNDQVWRQLGVEGELLARQGAGVTISRGVFGSYWFELDSGRGCKVTRLR